MYKQLADLAANKISAAITETHSGEQLVKAVLDPYNMEGSSIHVNFTTSNPRRYETSEHKSHINYVIGDSDWELDMAEALENSPRVLAYIKNHSLGFEVPYLLGSEPRKYRPDFIVKVDDGVPGDPLNLIIEVKGYRGEASIEKANTMKAFWVPGVNNLKKFGRWAFKDCLNLTNIKIPDSVTSIGDWAFSYCNSLTAITFLGDAPKIENDAFEGCSPTIYRKADAKGWGDTLADRPVKLIGEAPSEKPIAATPPAKTGKKFPSSFKELMFGSNPVVTEKDKAFWNAAKKGDLKAIRSLLSEGVNVDIYGDYGCTALFWAAKHNHKEVVFWEHKAQGIHKEQNKVI